MSGKGWCWQMANNDGWIKLHRKLSANDIWLEKPFSKGQAWIDLLMFATQNTHKSVRGKTDVTYKQGYVYESISYLADRWGWSRSKIYRFYSVLENAGMIEFKGWTGVRTANTTHRATPLRIVNWAFYQGERTEKRTRSRTANETHPKKDIYPKNDISKEPPKSPTGGLTPDGEIPDMYRDRFNSYAEYVAWRNQ